MPYELPQTDAKIELEKLLIETRNQEHQAAADEALTRRSQFKNDERYSGAPNFAIRATSPHILSVHNNSDRMVQMENSQFREIHVQLVPTSRESSTFIFNQGVNILANCVLSEQPVIEDKTSLELLSHLEVGKFYFDHGDLPGWFGLARIDEQGSMIAHINNEAVWHCRKLSALFSEKAEQGPDVERKSLTGLWVLALALKIQQKARAEGTVYGLLMSKHAVRPPEGHTPQSLAQMLLKLDR